jgi:hypothetical protein
MSTRNTGRFLGWLAIAAVLAGGCLGTGSSEPVPTLTRDDVTGLPPGDAVGTIFSGYYLVATSRLAGCHCRVGRCNLFYGTVGGLLQFEQQGGLFTSVDPPLTGGINADGTFGVGGADESAEMTQYVREKGHIRLVDGVPDTATFTTTVTFVGEIYTMDGATDVDCDLRADGTFRYQGPA